MANKAKATKIIAAHGGAIDWDVSFVSSGEKSVLVDAPDGHIWDYSASGVIAVTWYCGSASDFWDEVIEAVSCGTTKEI